MTFSFFSPQLTRGPPLWVCVPGQQEDIQRSICDIPQDAEHPLCTDVQQLISAIKACLDQKNKA